MNAAAEPKPGVFASLKRIADTLVAAVCNRIELFAVELQEEKGRLVEAILCTAAVVAFGLMTLSLVTLTVVVLFWENGRLIALGCLSVVHLAGTALAWRALQSRLKGRRAFADTVEELRKDCSCLGTDN